MIEQYLEQLKAELAGADPALVQDALYDAGEYLMSEMEARAGEQDQEAAFAGVVEAYGSPAEIAEAYRTTEVTVAAALRPPVREERRGVLASFFGVLVDPKAYAGLFYVLLAFVTGILYFTVTVTVLSVVFGFTASVVLIPVAALLLLAFFAVVRAISLVEGRMLEALFGVRMPRRPRAMLRQGNIGERLTHWLSDRRSWTTMVYMLLQLPLGVVYFSLAVSGIAISSALVAWPIAQQFTDYPLVAAGGYGYILQPWAVPLVVLAGLLGFVLVLHGMKLIGTLHAQWAKLMLVGKYESNAA